MVIAPACQAGDRGFEARRFRKKLQFCISKGSRNGESGANTWSANRYDVDLGCVVGPKRIRRMRMTEGEARRFRKKLQFCIKQRVSKRRIRREYLERKLTRCRFRMRSRPEGSPQEADDRRGDPSLLFLYRAVAQGERAPFGTVRSEVQILSARLFQPIVV
jgi:hypothetical protein